MAIPEICAQTQGSDYWQLIHCFCVCICAGIWPLLLGAGKKASMDVVLISRFWTHPSKLHQTCFLGVYHIYKTFPVRKKKSKQKQRKCPEMPFRSSQLQRDCSVRVCCFHRSHFGFTVALVQVQIYCYWRSVTTFLTSHIQYLPLYKRKWVKTVISTTASWFL